METKEEVVRADNVRRYMFQLKEIILNDLDEADSSYPDVGSADVLERLKLYNMVFNSVYGTLLCRAIHKATEAQFGFSLHINPNDRAMLDGIREFTSLLEDGITFLKSAKQHEANSTEKSHPA
jgi:hypothetical protein